MEDERVDGRIVINRILNKQERRSCSGREPDSEPHNARNFVGWLRTHWLQQKP